MSTVKVKFRPSIIDGKEGKIYYQITHNRVVRQLCTNYKIYPNEWNDDTSSIIINDESRRNHINIIKDLIDRDLSRFKIIRKKYEEKRIRYKSDDIITTFIEYIHKYSFVNFMKAVIEQLRQMNKLRTVETYSTTLRSFMNFRGGNDLIFEEINSDMMVMYEAYLHNNGLTKNTTSFYMRILRAVYNRAVEKEITMQRYPFKHVYTGIDKTVKRAIPINAIKQIKSLDLSNKPLLEFSRDIFMFSFYTRGMSFIDMAYLKKEDLKGNILTYRRRKTGQRLNIKWEKCMQDILNKYHTNNNNPFLLPILRYPSEDCRKQYKTALFRTNRHLKKIAEIVGISTDVTLYVARHSWASAARSKNIPLSVISEGMGHDSESTTQIYLASLDTSVVDKANTLILNDLQ